MTDAGVPVDFAGDLPFSQPRYRKALEEKGIRVFIGREALLSHLQAHGMEYRVVILSRPEVAHDYLPIVRAFALNARVLYDTVDLHWVRFTRAGQVLTDIAGLSERAADYRRLEMANARCADVTIAITGEERDALLAEAPDLDVTVLPNIHEVPPRVAPFRERRDLLFIGGFSHEPNVDAVHYFVSHILPYVTVKLPKVRFRILGSNMPASIRTLASPQVDPVGFVPEVEPYFDRARIFVAPLRHGAGMKGKVGQSLSFGLPVVTTSVGAEGMGLVDGENALVSDEPEGFAERILRLYDNQELWTRLSAAGRDVIVSRFSEEAMRPQVLALVGAAGPVLPNAEPRTQAVA
jgi:glycosyltransferase involved in cell wall biosynthesis